MGTKHKYTAINIGPIVDTISLGRKPREIWSASYMFCYLMECIIGELDEKTILSPAKIVKCNKGEVVSSDNSAEQKSHFKEVGLYPDRLFVKGDIDIDEVIKRAERKFKETTGVGMDYVNIMHVSIERDNDTDVIKDLNQLLDCMELHNRPVEDDANNKVLKLIRERKDNKLFAMANDGKGQINKEFLGEIATAKVIDRDDCIFAWLELYNELENPANVNKEDEVYVKLKQALGSEYRSYYKYICIVQADGDNMGKIVSSAGEEKIKELSKALLAYGSDASQHIKAYGGLPIYAGGDDLLFIAPVVSNHLKAHNIFELLEYISKQYKEMVDDKITELGISRPKDEETKEDVYTTVSYGLSISYYKYPLYEAFRTARELLFDTAKNVPGKDAIAWCLRKHSGSGFTGEITKSSKTYKIFKTLIKETVDEAQISAIAHKLRANEDLLNILREIADKDKREERIKAFYLKTMEEPKEQTGDTYIGKTRELLCALFEEFAVRADKETKKSDKEEAKEVESKAIEKVLSTMYGMLRTAKFINGEGDNDE